MPCTQPTCPPPPPLFLLPPPPHCCTVLLLVADEVDDFIKLLDSRELAASADEALLAHLLLRADSINRRQLDWRRLKVRKCMCRESV